ncbi:MAG: MazG nucleotide pyrophosphohydrolase domain-containing protein, partial [Candidatus Eisenbacteria bacterium]
IQEELSEVEQALAGGSRADVREELGDLLFAVANLARRLEVDPESALRDANQKFRRRWNRMMAIAEERGDRPEQLGLDRLDALWDAVKAEDRDTKQSGGGD